MYATRRKIQSTYFDKDSIVGWEMMTRKIIPADPMSAYGEVVRIIKGRPSEIEAEAATFQKVDLPSDGAVILANYPAWLSQRRGADA